MDHAKLTSVFASTARALHPYFEIDPKPKSTNTPSVTQGGPWTTIAVDIARAEQGEAEVERLKAIPPTEAFGIAGTVDLPCLPVQPSRVLNGLRIVNRSSMTWPS
jgi:hypothetical protein